MVVAHQQHPDGSCAGALCTVSPDGISLGFPTVEPAVVRAALDILDDLGPRYLCILAKVQRARRLIEQANAEGDLVADGDAVPSLFYFWERRFADLQS